MKLKQILKITLLIVILAEEIRSVSGKFKSSKTEPIKPVDISKIQSKIREQIHYVKSFS